MLSDAQKVRLGGLGYDPRQLPSTVQQVLGEMSAEEVDAALALIGQERAAVLRRLPSPAVAEMVGAQYY